MTLEESNYDLRHAYDGHGTFVGDYYEHENLLVRIIPRYSKREGGTEYAIKQREAGDWRLVTVFQDLDDALQYDSADETNLDEPSFS
jgi:hypothetical protein